MRLTGAEYGDSEAVAAMLAFREWSRDFEVVPLVVAGATPELFMSYTTPDLPTGEYKFDLVAVVEGSNSGTELTIDLRVDSVSRGPINQVAGLPNGDFLFGAPGVEFLSGVHTFELWISHPGGPGTATAKQAAMMHAREV